MDTKALRQKILDLATRGKLVPQDPNDEPASVLLERIRAEKQQMVKEGKLKPKDIKNDTIIFVGEDNLHYEKFQDGTVKCIENEIPFEVPEGWAWCRLNKLFHVCSAKRVRQSDWREEGVPFYRAREIVKLSDNGFVENELFISEEHYIRVKEECGVPQSGDLMVSGVGTIGKIYIVNETDCFYYKDASVLCFENRTGIVNSEFARILLESSFLQAQMKDNSKGTTVDTITISAAMNYLCLLPPLKEQENIVQAVKNACIYAEEIQNNKDNLQILISKTKSKILDLAIRGQLVPQSPDDEPASVLLERIRAEKEELIKAGKIKRDKKESIIFRGEDNSYYEKVGDKVHCIDAEIPFDLPELWTFARLKHIGGIVGGGTPKTNISEYWDGNIPWLTPADFSGYDSMYISNGSRTITEFGLKSSSAQMLPTNSILFSSRAPIGYTAIATNPVCTNQGFKSVVPYDFSMSPYLYYSLKARTDNIIQRATGTTFKEISGSEMAETIIPIPPLNEQSKIVEKVTQLQEVISFIEKSLS